MKSAGEKKMRCAALWTDKALSNFILCKISHRCRVKFVAEPLIPAAAKYSAVFVKQITLKFHIMSPFLLLKVL
jgi:hypothetical protein